MEVILKWKYCPALVYPVKLLGVEVPSLFAGQDSADFYAGATADYLRNLLEDRRVRLKGFDGAVPETKYGSFRAYVDIEYDNSILSLNKTILNEGYGTYSVYYKQNTDSIKAFKLYEKSAEAAKKGIWKFPTKIGTHVPRLKEILKGDAIEAVFPININIADQATLQLLPGIGEVYAKRIIEYRVQNGGFKTIDELMNIRGIGEKRLQRLRPVVTL